MGSNKPILYPFIILPTLILVTIYSQITILGLYAKTRNLTMNEIPFSNAALIGAPTFCIAAVLSVLIANLILRSVGTFRRVAERYVKSENRPEYEEAQIDLLVLLCYVLLGGIPPIILGFLMG